MAQLLHGGCGGHVQLAEGCTARPACRLQHPARLPRSRRGCCICASDGQRFDETAASVRRLLKRDRKDLQASSATWQPEWEEGGAHDEAVERQQSKETSTSAPVTGSGPDSAAGSPPSPFASNGNGAPRSSIAEKPQRQKQNPFGTGSRSANPFDDPKDLWRVVEPMESDSRPWWQKVTFGQAALGVSFLLVIGLMFATFYVTIRLGGVSYNE